MEDIIKEEPNDQTNNASTLGPESQQNNNADSSADGREIKLSDPRDQPTNNKPDKEDSPVVEIPDTNKHRPTSMSGAPISTLADIDPETLPALSQDMNVSLDHFKSLGAGVRPPEIKVPMVDIQHTSNALSELSKNALAQTRGIGQFPSTMIDTVQSALATNERFLHPDDSISVIMREIMLSGESFASVITAASEITEQLALPLFVDKIARSSCYRER
jgi:hypothetical protein